MTIANKKTNVEQQNLSPDIIASLNDALKHQRDEQLKHADKLYKKALVESKHQTDVVLMAAIFYQQIGRQKYVITLLKKALLKTPHHFKINLLLGKTYLEEQQYENAERHLNEACLQDPANAEASLHLATALHRTGQIDRALPLYKKAITAINAAQNSDHPPLSETDQQQLYCAIADVLVTLNQNSEAAEYLKTAIKQGIANYDIFIRLALITGEGSKEGLHYCLHAMQQNLQRDEAKIFFARSCKRKCFPELPAEQTKILISSCLASKNVDHHALAYIWIETFLKLTNSEQATELCKAKDFESFSELCQHEDIKQFFFDDFFLNCMANIRSDNLAIERFYTHLRRHYLLHLKNNQQLSDKEMALLSTILSAMARQCYLNEFVLHITDEESSYITETKQKIETFIETDQQHEITPELRSQLLIYACYQSLENLENAETLLKFEKDPHLREVLTTELKQPQEEKQFRKTIRSVGVLDNQVSQNVRQHYEENPYPRWNTESMLTQPHIKAIDKSYLRVTNVLIAGCGTGKQILADYNYYPNARFTAIDLSYASLSYTKRKLIEYGIDKNVDLIHCDILDVGKLGKFFDHIECCGVLHHMQDPLAGLKSLTRILNPGGQIKIALYSQLARRAIHKAKAIIKQQRFASTPEGIRQCREYMCNEIAANRLDFPLHQWSDFYTTSECRDLLFHTQETCYHLEEIEQMLDEAGLKFDGFFFTDASEQKFREKFPEAESTTNLKLWAEFEQENPDTFTGMYQFKAIKPKS